MAGMIAAIVSGALMSIQGVFNTNVTRQTGAWFTNMIVQITGFILSAVLWFVLERKKVSLLACLEVRPRYLLLGGILGAFITFTVITGMTTLGPAKAVMLIVAAQLIVAYLIEIFGIFGVEKVPFDWIKLLGAGLFVCGIILFKIRD